LTPWSGSNFNHAVAVTSWDWLLYLDGPDLDKIRGFMDAHYLDAPEPNGGPAKPAG
jgi:hypothetical protein